MVTLEDVQEARAAIAPHGRPTPLEHSPALGRLTGCEVYLKGCLVRLEDPRSLADKAGGAERGGAEPRPRAAIRRRGRAGGGGGDRGSGLRFPGAGEPAVEGAGAAALATARRLPSLAGKRVVLIVTGGNLDGRVLAGIIERHGAAAPGGRQGA